MGVIFLMGKFSKEVCKGGVACSLLKLDGGWEATPSITKFLANLVHYFGTYGTCTYGRTYGMCTYGMCTYQAENRAYAPPAPLWDMPAYGLHTYGLA